MQRNYSAHDHNWVDKWLRIKQGQQQTSGQPDPRTVSIHCRCIAKQKWIYVTVKSKRKAGNICCYHLVYKIYTRAMHRILY